jgi:hypothetical protein
MPTVLVDARNVARSRWPNLSEHELLEHCTAWANARELDVILVFDGRIAGDHARTEQRRGAHHVRIVESGSESADDRIVAEAAPLGASGVPYWLVTSDRELRERAGTGAERVIGGGTFLRELRELDA